MKAFGQGSKDRTHAVKIGQALRSRSVKLAKRFAADENGATSIEYGLIVSLIFLAIVGAVRSFTTQTGVMYGEIEDAMAE